jgi:hypothetical protein
VVFLFLTERKYLRDILSKEEGNKKFRIAIDIDPVNLI